MSGQPSSLFRSLDLAGMEHLAQSMVEQLPVPLVIGLVGTLGAGKTSLVQAIARAAGIDSADVTSPTFSLLQTYRGSPVLHHLDAYRLADEDEFLELGVDELFEDPEAWTIVEWADRVVDVMPEDTLWIEITIEADADRRSVACTTADQRTVEALGRIREEFDRG
jgi:tRNA threonylcarbamoyladenosine biosynthesis protein TsaE